MLKPLACIALQCVALLCVSGQVTAGEAPAPVPFGPGERSEYEVRVGFFGGSGEASMEVLGIEEVRGHPTYHLSFRLEGGVLFAKVEDRLDSWLDVSRLVSLRFDQNQHEVNYERHRIYEFYPEMGRWIRENGSVGSLATEEPLDDVSFVYFARTLPLEVGTTHTLSRYFKEDGNPVILEVLRKERIDVPAGTFDTIVVRPIIRTSGLFGEGGEAELFFTDDDRRVLVQMRSRIPILGHLNLVLKSFEPGAPIPATAASIDH
ncbi:MAG: DUF3108 domain-containing protein [Candidatus Eisenbacteria bacterium]|nr:DUF3108 domain-containing protein [Candidatus Latescibacterota bacterium]MBD3302818.1 DUF3108 domain-containing protein [Candidatus Eisenbacteria bacterium]